ncbi:MAG: hypothetical protein R3227_10580 [Reinekea sp.]|nr:hypothetical protein [Reinekea sp.]
MNNLKWILQPLSGFAVGMLLVLNLSLYFFWYVPGLKNLISATDQLGSSLVRNLAFESTSPLHASDRAALSELLNRVADEPAVLSASVSADEEGGIQLTSRVKRQAEGNGRHYQFPIHFSEELLGTAQLNLSEYDLTQWQSQAITSWVLFNLLSAAGLGAFIYLRTQKHEKQWQKISSLIDTEFPELSAELSGTPDQQLQQLMERLNDPLSQQMQLLRYMRHDSINDDTERLLEQIELVSNEGSYQDVALLSIQCQNWEQLIRTYSAPGLQALWSDYETLMIRTGELYSGILLPDGFSLAFGLNEENQFAFNAVCAARVLQIAMEKLSAEHTQLRPVFGISVSAGPAFVSKTHKHGIPLPLVTGDAETWLAQIKALQPMGQIFFAEPLLQFEDVNQQVEASIVRDITLRDGYRLEVWELDKLRFKDDLLTTQANTLINTNRQ